MMPTTLNSLITTGARPTPPDALPKPGANASKPAGPSFASVLKQQQPPARADSAPESSPEAAVDEPEEAKPFAKARSRSTDKVADKAKAPVASAKAPAEAAATGEAAKTADDASASTTDPVLAQWLAQWQASDATSSAKAGAALDGDAELATVDATATATAAATAAAAKRNAAVREEIEADATSVASSEATAEAAAELPFQALLADQKSIEQAVGVPITPSETHTTAPHALVGQPPPGVSGSAAAPTPVAVPTPVNAPDFSQVLGAQLTVLAQDGVQQAELHLNPAEMGPVSVQIVMDGTQARIDFGADDANTRQVLEAGLPELAGALRDAGFTLTGGSVSQHSRGRGDGGGGESGSGDDQRGSSAIERAQAEGSANLARRNVSAGGLDLYA